MGSGHHNKKAWNTKCQRSGIATGTGLETSLRPRYATEDDTLYGDDPNDDQASALPHHEPKPPKMVATDNSVSSSGYRTSDTTVGPTHSECGPENPRRSKRVRQPRKLYCCWMYGH